MFRPVALFVGLRYTRARRRNHFVSFIALVSMLGIALGVTVLITVLSVMNGFDQEIRTRIFQLAPQVLIRTFSTTIPDWQPVAQKMTTFPNVVAVAPLVDGQAMLTHGGVVRPVVIDGIDPEKEIKVSDIKSKMTEGNFSALKPGSFGIVVGQELAEDLSLHLGDQAQLITTETTVSPMGVQPRFKNFKVVGIFHAGSGFGYDDHLAIINISDAQKLLELGNSISGIRLRVNDFFAAPEIAHKIAETLTPEYFVNDWTQHYGPLFKAIKLEKSMMFFILLLIVAVAAFNLVSSLVMIVNDKRSDIAIMRTFGATPMTIMGIFIVQGFIVGVFGTLLGLIGGITLAMNVTDVVTFIQNNLGVQLLSSKVYYVDYLPSLIQWSDVISISIAAFLLCLLATLYPAWSASRTQPAEALRYE